MAARPGYGQPDPRNPFANPPQQQYAPRREYDAESDMSDQYGRSESTTHLAANYDQNSPYDSYSGVWILSVVVIHVPLAMFLAAALNRIGGDLELY